MGEGVFLFIMDNKIKIFEAFKKLYKVSTDTRMDVSNSLFFALSGENFDGNKFALQALQKGASYAVIDNPEYKINDKYILVNDVLKALQDLALRHRQSLKTTILAITGSNGKTTTKELVSSVLSTEKKIISTAGNFNNHIGVPLSILNIKPETEIAIIEMGANHRGEIKNLCKIATPDIGIITNIGKAHLEGFGSFEGVIATKNELYESINSRKGEIIKNADDKLLMQMGTDTKSFTYGTKNANVIGEIISANPSLIVKWTFNNSHHIIKSKLYGSYNFANIMAAVAVGIFFNIKAENINFAIESYLPSNNRSQLYKTSKNSLILDAYNANPVSMQNAIKSFKDFDAPNSLLILGDMFELGNSSKEEHKKIIELLKTVGFINVFLVGEAFYNLREPHNFNSFKKTSDLKEFLNMNPLNDKSILIKGSRGMKLESLVEVL